MKIFFFLNFAFKLDYLFILCILAKLELSLGTNFFVKCCRAHRRRFETDVYGLSGLYRK